MRGFHSLFLIAAFAVEAAHVVTSSGRRIEGDSISAEADGSVTLKRASGQTMTFRVGQYQSAGMPRPGALKTAETLFAKGENAAGVALLNKVKTECAGLAWDQTATRRLGDHFLAEKKYAEAAAEYAALADQTAEIRGKRFEALIGAEKSAEALALLNESIARGDRAEAAEAYVRRGELKRAANDEAGARRDWLKVVMFFKAEKDAFARAESNLKEDA